MKRIRAVRKDCWAVEMAQGWTHLPCIYEDQNLLEPTSMLGGHGCQPIIPTLRRQRRGSLELAWDQPKGQWDLVPVNMVENDGGRLPKSAPASILTHSWTVTCAHTHQTSILVCTRCVHVHVRQNKKENNSILTCSNESYVLYRESQQIRGNMIAMGLLGLWNNNTLSNVSLLCFQMPDELNKCIGTLDSM